MIPEDQFVPVGGEVLFAVLDERSQCIGIRHRLGSQIFLQKKQPAFFYLIDLISTAADHIVVPAAASAGINDQVDIVRDFGGDHLLEVGSRHLAPGFQVGAAQIDHDRHDIFAASLDHSAFFPGFGSHLGIGIAPAVGSSPAPLCFLGLLRNSGCGFRRAVVRVSPEASIGALVGAAVVIVRSAAARAAKHIPAAHHIDYDRNDNDRQTESDAAGDLAAASAVSASASAVPVLVTDRSCTQAVASSIQAASLSFNMSFPAMRFLVDIHNLPPVWERPVRKDRNMTAPSMQQLPMPTTSNNFLLFSS